MKNAMSKHHETVVAFLKANPNSSFDTIKESNNISDIMLRKVIKDLQEEGIISANDEDGNYVFTGSSKKTEADTKAEEKETTPEITSTVGARAAKKKASVDEEDLGPATVSGKDFTRYDFNGLKALSKSRLVHAIIKEYVTKNPKTTLAKLEEVFESREIQKRYGVVEELSKAKKLSGTRDRYFMKPEEVLKVGDKKVAVCNQWSSETLKPLLGIAKNLGYKITVSK